LKRVIQIDDFHSNYPSVTYFCKKFSSPERIILKLGQTVWSYLFSVNETIYLIVFFKL
jgi:hypothetical protein